MLWKEINLPGIAQQEVSKFMVGAEKTVKSKVVHGWCWKNRSQSINNKYSAIIAWTALHALQISMHSAITL